MKSNPYKSPGAAGSLKTPVWRIVALGWLVGLIIGSIIARGMPWMHAVFVTIMIGATGGLLTQLFFWLRRIS